MGRTHMNAIGLLIIILLLVIAPTLAYATNESSYKDAFRIAGEDYSCTTPEMAGRAVTLCSSFDNQTDCVDGYIHGWKHWCTTHAKDCIRDIATGSRMCRGTKSDIILNTTYSLHAL
jgi:hypothetical protein